MATMNFVTAARYDASHGVPDRKSRDFGFSGGNVPPAAVLDRIADEKFSGGFKLVKKNLCPKCFLYRPVNGACCE
jgi:hypothetical protein